MNEELFAAIEVAYEHLKSQFPESQAFKPSCTAIKEYYHIGHRLDEGKKSIMSEVRVCTHRQSQKRFAVKSYYLGDGKESSSDIIFTKRRGLKFSLILNEIHSQLLLEHPNICKLHEIYLEPKYIHLVMDYCRGGELYDYLASNKPMLLSEAFPLFLQLLDALDYMRSQSVVHRALSIENIMFYDAERLTVKIISFSSSGIGDRFNEKFGCALYMAPEVFNDNYDSRCDIWSLGIVFYCLVVGFQPFQGKNLQEIISRVSSSKLPKNTVWKKLPKSLKEFIKSMLKKESHRATAEELLDSKFVMKYSNKMPEFVFLKLMRAQKPIVASEEYMVKVQLANKIKRTIVKIMENRKILPNLTYLEEIWKKVDKQNLKVVTIQAFETYFSSLPAEFQETSDNFFEVFKRYDNSKNNTIAYLDFLATLSFISDRNLIGKVFEILDENQDGLVDTGNFYKESGETPNEMFDSFFVEVMGKPSMSKEDLNLLMIKYSS